MSIEQRLKDLGAEDRDISEMASMFGLQDESAFLADMQTIAESVIVGGRPNTKCTTEPWATICEAITQGKGTPEEAYEAKRSVWSATVQAAIDAVIPLAYRPAAAVATKRQAKKKPYKIAPYLAALSQLGYSFRMNDLSDTIEVNGKAITDEKAAEIRARMRDAGFEFVNVMEDIYRMDAASRRYNPITDHLDTLKYDGGNHIEKLAEYFTCKYGVFGTWLRRWLIGSVAKVRDHKQNFVLVVDGPQGIGKSMFSKWLCPLPDLYCEQAINLDDKDSYVRMAYYWVWEVAEFGQTLRKVDRELFKNFISQSRVTVRKPYGHYDMVKPSMASLLGTVNDEVGVLDDPTGSRRFAITHIEKINWAYRTECDVNQVWAEAQAAYLAGEPFAMTGDERQRANEINAMYEVEDPVEGLLLKYYRVDKSLMRSTWVSSQEILSNLETSGLKGTTRQNSMALAIVMKRLGCTREKHDNVHGQRVWGYCGISAI